MHGSFVLPAILLASVSAPVWAGGTDAASDARAAVTEARSNVATAQKPATYPLRGSDPGAEALELTVRPIAADESAGYLVQVFVESSKDAPPKPVGSFSFFPARVGQAQTFVLPKPEGADAGQDMTLSIKLVSANAARNLKDTAVEILGARLVK